MATTAELWERMERFQREVSSWGWLAALASWDQQTGMPASAAADRQEQEAALTRLLHEKATDPRFGDLLDQLEDRDDLDELQTTAVGLARWAWSRTAVVPPELAERVTRTRSETMAAWLQARQTGDATRWLETLVPLLGAVRERAALVRAATGSDGPLYDTLLEDYDRGVRSVEVAALFERLVPGLRALLARVDAPGPDLGWTAPAEAQEALCREVVAAIGFDLTAGRLDRSEHPFTTRCGVRDVRITTRFLPSDPMAALFASLHEAGHGMYEQGMAPSLLPYGLLNAPSTGLHESQSRFWENAIGRSEAFLTWVRGPMERRFGPGVPELSALVRSANRVRPSLIRVEADEVTYNLHVALRFELEQQLIAGSLTPRDLPEAWDAACERILGIRPPDMASGVLQDIHWSYGLFGYFPSYTLGNVWSASLLARLREEVPVDALVREGTFSPVLDWFRTRIHQHGASLTAPEILRRAVGERDPVADLLAHLAHRHAR